MNIQTKADIAHIIPITLGPPPWIPPNRPEVKGLFDDVLFEMVNEEMNKSYVFQSELYLTQAGYDEFEEAWFEFYHEHYGDILYQVMKNITN